MSASADVISAEIAGAVALSARRRKFLARRRDRHARTPGALICASSEINPFYPERDSISIFPSVATRKIFTRSGGDGRKTNIARRRAAAGEGREGGRRGGTRCNVPRREGGGKGKGGKGLISRIAKIMKISTPGWTGARRRPRKERRRGGGGPLESFAITGLD